MTRASIVFTMSGLDAYQDHDQDQDRRSGDRLVPCSRLPFKQAADPLNNQWVAVVSISSAHLHVRRTPCDTPCGHGTCRWANEIKDNHPPEFWFAGLERAAMSLCSVGSAKMS